MAIQIANFRDGARMTRNSSLILISFALLHSDDEVMAAKRNHTIAVVKGKEVYKTLALKDINSPIASESGLLEDQKA